MKSGSLIYLGFYAAVFYATYLLLLLSIPYLDFKPNIEFLVTKQLVYHIDLWRIAFYVHVFSSVFVIFSGAFQFSKVVIKKYPRWHRFFGYTYISLLLLISGPGALIMSFYANGGIPAQTSFVILSILWISFTLIALVRVFQKRYLEHGKWLLRSYALTLSAVTLRFYLLLFDYFNVNLGPIESYILVAYLSWIPNLIFAEIMIRKRFVEFLLR